MKRTLTIAIVLTALVFGSAACTKEDVARDAIRQSFPEQYDRAVAIANCESGLDPEAVSAGGGNWGLFQINTVHKSLVASMGYSWSQMTDPYVNAKVARRLYDSSGWRPWSCSRYV